MAVEILRQVFGRQLGLDKDDNLIIGGTKIYFGHNRKLDQMLDLLAAGDAGIPGVVADGITPNDSAMTDWLGSIGSTPTAATISGPVLLNSSVAIPSNVQLSIPMGGKIKRGANAIISLNCAVSAGAWPIFDNSLGGSGAFTGLLQNAFGYTEWFGAGQGGTDDSAAFQALARLSLNAGCFTILLLPKTYLIKAVVFADGTTTAQSFVAPVWKGVSSRKSIIDCTGIGAGNPAFRFVGGSGQQSGGRLEDLCVKGDGLSMAVEFAGQNGASLLHCRVEGHAVGVQCHNDVANTFTELCRAYGTEFINNVVDWRNKRTLGNDSFNSCGMDQTCTISKNSDNGTIVDIGSGCKTYDNVLDLRVWTNGHPTTLVNNQSGLQCNFEGRVKWETPDGTVLTLGAGGVVDFEGPLGGAGASVNRGTLRHSTKTLLLSNGGRVTISEGATVGYFDSTGVMLMPSLDSQKNREVYLQMWNSNFDVRWRGVANHNGYGQAGTWASQPSFPISITVAAGYGTPTLSVNASGQVVVTFGTAIAFTATPALNATSGTLTGNFSGTTGTYIITFANGDLRVASLTNGATSCTWTGGLSSATSTGGHVATISNTVTLTGSPSSGAVSATLNASWGGATGVFNMVFNTGEVRAVSLTNGATTATWTTPLASNETTTLVGFKIPQNTLQYGLYEKLFDMNNLQNAGLQLNF